MAQVKQVYSRSGSRCDERLGSSAGGPQAASGVTDIGKVHPQNVDHFWKIANCSAGIHPSCLCPICCDRDAMLTERTSESEQTCSLTATHRPLDDEPASRGVSIVRDGQKAVLAAWLSRLCKRHSDASTRKRKGHHAYMRKGIDSSKHS